MPTPIGPDGIDIARSDGKPPIDYHDRQYFQQVMRGLPTAHETIVHARSTGRPALNMAGPILDPAGKVLGALVVGMDLDSLSAVVGAARYGHTGYSFVVDAQGHALAHPDINYASSLKDLSDLPPVRGRDSRAGPSSSTAFRTDAGCSGWPMRFPCQTAGRWSACSKRPKCWPRCTKCWFLPLLVTAAAATVMIGLTWLITTRMVRPILSMTATAIDIADGDWKQRIPEDRQDELGTLAKAFNKMVRQLESAYRAVEEKVALLSAALAERNQALEQVTKLSLAVEQSPASVVITDPQGVIEYVNPRFTVATGYSAEEAMGHLPSVLKSGLHSAEFYKNLWDTLLSGHEWRGELCNRKKDGSLYWELTSISPIRNDQGEITHFVAVKEDVTAQKLTQEQLTVFRRFAETSGQGFGMADLRGCLTYANPTLLHLLGASQLQDLTGRPVTDFFPDQYRRWLQREVFPHAISHGRWSGELPICAGGVETRPTITETFLIRDDKASPFCLALMITDITERKHAEEALRKKEEEFRQAQKLEAVGALAGGVAHEFNNLLQAIRAFTSFALKGLEPEEQRYRDLQEVLKAAERAAHLTGQLLGFSRRQHFRMIDVQAERDSCRSGEDVAAADRREDRVTDDSRCPCRPVACRPDHAATGGDESVHKRPGCHAQGRKAADPNGRRGTDNGRLCTHIRAACRDAICG